MNEQVFYQSVWLPIIVFLLWSLCAC